MEAISALIAGGLVFWWLIKSQERRNEEWARQAEEAKARSEKDSDEPQS